MLEGYRGKMWKVLNRVCGSTPSWTVMNSEYGKRVWSWEQEFLAKLIAQITMHEI